MDIAQLYRINLLVKVLMGGDRWGAAMRKKRCDPKFKQLVNFFLRKLCLGKEELCKLETSTRRERRPIVVRLRG